MDELAYFLPYRIVNKKFEFLLLKGRCIDHRDPILDSISNSLYLGNVELNNLYYLWSVDLTNKELQLTNEYIWTSTILNSIDPLVYTSYVKLKAKLKELELQIYN